LPRRSKKQEVALEKANALASASADDLSIQTEKVNTISIRLEKTRSRLAALEQEIINAAKAEASGLHRQSFPKDRIVSLMSLSVELAKLDPKLSFVQKLTAIKCDRENLNEPMSMAKLKLLGCMEAIT
jgi:hypothetical protein